MVLSLKIVGYYEHNNFGDDQYKLSMNKLFSTYLNSQDYEIDFLDCDKIYLTTFMDTDIIIIGGGDILNPYFLNKINSKFSGKPNLIIGLSVGLPYPKILIETSLLEIIDYIFIRTTQDLQIFNQYFHYDRIYYIPDLSYLLSNNYTFTKSLQESEKIITNMDLQYSQFVKGLLSQTKTNTFSQTYIDYSNILKRFKQNGKVLGICLSRHFYNKNYTNEYSKICQGLIKFIRQCIIREEYNVVFIPFNTNSINPNEDDTVFAQDLIQNLGDDVLDNVLNITNKLSNDEMNDLFSRLDLCIPMRFHSVLYCIYNFVPFVSVYTTRKIHNLLLETEWNYRYRLQLNDKLVPIDFDPNVLSEQILKLRIFDEFRQNIYHKLLHINTNLFGKMFFKNVKTLIDIILCRRSSSKDLDTQGRITNVDSIITNTYDTIIEFAKSRSYDNYRSITDTDTRETLVSIISYNLIGLINSDYNYGMSKKIFDLSKDYNYKDEWRWILNDYISKDKRNIISNPNGLFNMEYMDQIDYSGAHRSGWQYVYEHIEALHNRESDVLLDLYVDRTFHWNKNVNSELNLIPYKQLWIGFVHHTFDTSFSDYNCNNLFNSLDFVESLKTCKGLFVLSKYLKKQFDERLTEMGIDNVKVFALVHPTEIDVKQFQYKNMNKSPEMEFAEFTRSLNHCEIKDLGLRCCFADNLKILDV